MAASKRRREPAPPEEIARLATALERDPPRRGYVLRGPERYFRSRALELLRNAAEARGFEVCLHDARRDNPEFELPAAIEDLSGTGLFTSARMVVIQSPEGVLGRASAPTPLDRAIAAFLASDAPGLVVLAGATLRADHPVCKAVKKAGGELLALRRLWDGPPPWNPDPRQAELVQWLLALARERRIPLRPEEAVYVCAATGNDLFALEDKLAALATAPRGSLAERVPWDAASDPWTVADHVLSGDLARALGGIETLFRGGFLDKGGRRTLDLVALSSLLVAALNRGARAGLALARALEDGAEESAAVARARLGGPPRAVQAALSRARRRPARAWRLLLEDVAALEREAKTGGACDANALAAFALRWRVEKGAGAARRTQATRRAPSIR